MFVFSHDVLPNPVLERLAALALPFTLAAGALSCASGSREVAEPTPPNIVIIVADDQGYGDLGSFGSTTIESPRLDQLAREGTRFTSFYAQVVCGPSRSALLTGRYPIRSHGWNIPASEITLAGPLETVGYTTGAVGKWDGLWRRLPLLVVVEIENDPAASESDFGKTC